MGRERTLYQKDGGYTWGDRRTQRWDAPFYLEQVSQNYLTRDQEQILLPYSHIVKDRNISIGEFFKLIDGDVNTYAYGRSFITFTTFYKNGPLPVSNYTISSAYTSTTPGEFYAKDPPHLWRVWYTDDPWDTPSPTWYGGTIITAPSPWPGLYTFEYSLATPEFPDGVTGIKMSIYSGSTSDPVRCSGVRFYYYSDLP